MKDDRPKFDPTNPDDEVIAVDVEAWWELDRHIATWQEEPEGGPQVLIGVYGRPRHRFVIGAFAIDSAAWGDRPDVNKRGVKWRVPLADRTNPDASHCGDGAPRVCDSVGLGGSITAGSMEVVRFATRCPRSEAGSNFGHGTQIDPVLRTEVDEVSHFATGSRRGWGGTSAEVLAEERLAAESFLELVVEVVGAVPDHTTSVQNVRLLEWPPEEIHRRVLIVLSTNSHLMNVLFRFRLFKTSVRSGSGATWPSAGA